MNVTLLPLLQKAQALENELKKTPNENIRRELAACYKETIQKDLKFSINKEVDMSLWKTCFYKKIDIFRKNIKQVDKQILNDFKLFLDEAIGFYFDFIFSIEETIKSGLLNKFFSLFQIKVEYACSDLAIEKEVKMFYFHSLIFLGDLFRYSCQYCKSNQIVLTRNIYNQANLILIDNGNAENQLAVIENFRQNYFLACFHYFKSLMALNPFATAKSNLLALLNSNRENSSTLILNLINKILNNEQVDLQENAQSTLKQQFSCFSEFVIILISIDKMNEMKINENLFFQIADLTLASTSKYKAFVLWIIAEYKKSTRFIEKYSNIVLTDFDEPDINLRNFSPIGCDLSIGLKERYERYFVTREPQAQKKVSFMSEQAKKSPVKASAKSRPVKHDIVQQVPVEETVKIESVKRIRPAPGLVVQQVTESAGIDAQDEVIVFKGKKSQEISKIWEPKQVLYQKEETKNVPVMQSSSLFAFTQGKYVSLPSLNLFKPRP